MSSCILLAIAHVLESWVPIAVLLAFASCLLLVIALALNFSVPPTIVLALESWPLLDISKRVVRKASNMNHLLLSSFLQVSI